MFWVLPYILEKLSGVFGHQFGFRRVTVGLESLGDLLARLGGDLRIVTPGTLGQIIRKAIAEIQVGPDARRQRSDLRLGRGILDAGLKLAAEIEQARLRGVVEGYGVGADCALCTSR